MILYRQLPSTKPQAKKVTDISSSKASRSMSSGLEMVWGVWVKKIQATHNRKTPTHIPSPSKQIPALVRLMAGVKFPNLQKINISSHSSPAEEMAGF